MGQSHSQRDLSVPSIQMPWVRIRGHIKPLSSNLSIVQWDFCEKKSFLVFRKRNFTFWQQKDLRNFTKFFIKNLHQKICNHILGRHILLDIINLIFNKVSYEGKQNDLCFFRSKDESDHSVKNEPFTASFSLFCLFNTVGSK